MRKASYFTKSELELFKNQTPLFNDIQMKIINRKTPEAEIEHKTDTSGNPYKSIKAPYIKALVMLVTGGNFDFQIISEEFIQATKEIKTRARLTIRSNGKTAFREQVGQHHINTSGNSNRPSDIGNAYKAAATDAFKKCASEFGFCWDIYGQERIEQPQTETPEINHAEQKKLQRLTHFLQHAKTADEVEICYNTFLETSEETQSTKDLLFLNMKRVINKLE